MYQIIGNLCAYHYRPPVDQGNTVEKPELIRLACHRAGGSHSGLRDQGATGPDHRDYSLRTCSQDRGIRDV